MTWVYRFPWQSICLAHPSPEGTTADGRVKMQGNARQIRPFIELNRTKSLLLLKRSPISITTGAIFGHWLKATHGRKSRFSNDFSRCCRGTDEEESVVKLTKRLQGLHSTKKIQFIFITLIIILNYRAISNGSFFDTIFERCALKSK